ncbi:hypothetical protein HKD37_12G034438 [Glycine soja]
MKIQKKIPTTKTTQNALKYKAKTLLIEWPKYKAQKKEKSIQIFTKKRRPNLDPWAQKSTLGFMRTPRPSLAALAQSSWSLLSNTLAG